ncbi:MAG: ATP-dependent DNA ligase [Promethearchaeota archaeon]
MSFPAKGTPTLFIELSKLCERIVATAKHLEKMDLAGAFVANLPISEVEVAALLLIGQPFPRSSERALSLSWSGLRSILQEFLQPSSSTIVKIFRETGDIGEVVRQLYQQKGQISQTTLLSSPLTIQEVHQTFAAIADAKGSGSKRRKTAMLRSLFTRTTPLEAKYITKILVGDQRIGFSEGMLESTIARFFKIPLELVRRANMLRGNIGEVARIAVEKGTEGLKKVHLRPFTPLLPMLASQAKDVSEAIEQNNGKCAFEAKLDGARVQIHLEREKDGTRIHIFSRQLSDVTSSLPDIVDLVKREVAATSCILDGEVLALGPDGRPFPFQQLMRRFRRVHDIKTMVTELPVTLFLFDLLMLDNEVLIDESYETRRNKLRTINGSIPLVEQLITGNASDAAAFLESALRSGHEGLVAKRLTSSYQLGVRGKAWLKIKKSMETLDLVIIAAEYGSGRRHKWLSDYHLAAWDPETSEFHMLGKTFKGLTDTEFEEITRLLFELKIDQEKGIVTVQPQIVVEVEYGEIQQSPTYPSGMALRFARIKRIRYDKRPEEADTIQRVREIFNSQFRRKAQTNRVGRT